jgi:hypothetical protein
VLLLLQDFIHASWVHVVISRDSILEFAVPMPLPNNDSVFKRQAVAGWLCTHLWVSKKRPQQSLTLHGISLKIPMRVIAPSPAAAGFFGRRVVAHAPADSLLAIESPAHTELRLEIPVKQAAAATPPS